nr:low temperature requirement protein A [Microbacterium lacticum]
MQPRAVLRSRLRRGREQRVGAAAPRALGGARAAAAGAAAARPGPPLRDRRAHRRRALHPAHRRTHRATPWHPHHITERYGLFTLIVLGESLLASANAIIEALHESDILAPLVGMAALTLVVTAALWWIYFWPPHHTEIGGLRASIGYGYGHYFVFAAAAAFSAGIEVEIDVLTGKSELHEPWAAFTYTVPVAVFVFSVWLIMIVIVAVLVWRPPVESRFPA